MALIPIEGSYSITERGGGGVESVIGKLYQFLLINEKQNLNTVFYRGTQIGKPQTLFYFSKFVLHVT
jgi:hypothetical protein